MSQMGWIKLHRSLTNWEWYGSPKHLAVFMDLLLNANHKENNYRGMTIKRGQLTTSYNAISQRSGVSYQSVRTVLADLVATQEITYKSRAKCSIITILKWDTYQVDNIVPNSQINTLPTDLQQAANRQLTTNKNEKNEKNEKNIYPHPDGSGLLDKVNQVWNETIGNIDPFKPNITFRESTTRKFYSAIKENSEMKDIEFWKKYFDSLKDDVRFNGKGNLNNVATLDSIIRNENYVDGLNGQFGSNKSMSQIFSKVDYGNQEGLGA